MQIRQEEKIIKYLNSLQDWREYCLEAKYPNYNRVEFDYLPSMDYERCTISVSSVTITNFIRTLKYNDYIEINGDNYFIDNDYTGMTPVTFSVILDELLSSNIEVHLDYCNKIYLKCLDFPLIIHDMSYNMSLLLGIKLYQLPIALIEVDYEEIYTNEEEISEIVTENVINIPQYGDYNSTPIFYLRSNLGSNFFIQTMIDDKNKVKAIMTNLNISMCISYPFLPNLPITNIGGDCKNDCFTSVLTSPGYIELIDSNLIPVDLLYPMRLSLLAEFYYIYFC
jgi:hypothetical protein